MHESIHPLANCCLITDTVELPWKHIDMMAGSRHPTLLPARIADGDQFPVGE